MPLLYYPEYPGPTTEKQTTFAILVQGRDIPDSVKRGYQSNWVSWKNQAPSIIYRVPSDKYNLIFSIKVSNDRYLHFGTFKIMK